MRITNRLVIIVAVVLTVVGIGLTSAAVVMVNGDFKRLSTTDPYEEKEYYVKADGINTITFNDSSARVNIVKSNDNQIRLNYFENEKEYYTIDVSDNGELAIMFESNIKWQNFVGFNLGSRDFFEIAIPENIKCDISLKTSNGIITADNLSIDGDISLKTSNGAIALSNINTDGNVTAVTSRGSISASNLSSQDFSAKSSTGELRLTDVICEVKITAETSNGEIEIANISFGAGLKLKSSNGKITGTVRGRMEDFNIISRTSTGRNNLPEDRTGGNKTLEAKTSNGSIDIAFVE
ncbi:DUF4097 family beta strand repeat-containing protein [Oscillospiraceae bacterium PP1C4]